MFHKEITILKNRSNEHETELAKGKEDEIERKKL